MFVVLISANTLAQKNIKESIALQSPPVIDGDVSDWSCDWWLDPDGKFISNVANDAENLYVRLKIADDLTQQKIGLLGLSLKLNPKGKRRGKVGLKYPVGKDESELKKKPKEDKSLNEREAVIQIKKDLLNDVEVVELIGLAKKNIVSSRLGLANGIQVIIVAQNDGSYIYEAKIPFKAFRINKNEVEVLGIEFETGKYNPPVKNQSTPNTGMMSRPGSYGYGQQPMTNYNAYQYNPFSTPGYLFLAVKLK